MNVRYFGWIKTDSIGQKLTKPMPPAAVVTYTEEEEALAIARLEHTNYRFDSFDGCSYVTVNDRQDYQDFMEAWKDAKRQIKKRDLI